jgi:hypothetical protein
MPRYAILSIVEAPLPEQAWESVEERLLGDGEAGIAYVGAPWLVPHDSEDEAVEYSVAAIKLELNGKNISLSPPA